MRKSHENVRRDDKIAGVVSDISSSDFLETHPKLSIIENVVVHISYKIYTIPLHKFLAAVFSKLFAVDTRNKRIRPTSVGRVHSS